MQRQKEFTKFLTIVIVLINLVKSFFIVNWIFRSYIYQYYKPVLCLFRRNTSFVCLICFQLITISLIYPFWGTGLNIYDLATWKNAPCMIGYAQKLLSKFSIWFKATTRTRTSRKNCRFVYKCFVSLVLTIASSFFSMLLQEINWVVSISMYDNSLMLYRFW